MKFTRAIFLPALAVAAIALPIALQAQKKEITIEKIPDSPAEFTTMRDQIATTPEGGAAMLITALMAFSKDRELGMQCLTIALDSSNLSSGNVYQGRQPASSFNYHLKRMDGYKRWPYLGFAYVKGGTPENGYAVKNNPPYKIVTSRNKFSGDEAKGKVKIFVDVHGFRARPITLQKNDKGHWKAKELSSVWLDVYKPKSEAPEEL